MNKKLALLLVLLAALVMGSVSSASAAEIKASGSWQIDAQWVGNLSFQDKGSMDQDKAFSIGQRVRTAFEFIANENLKAVLDTQIGTANWGSGPLQMNSGRQAVAGAGSGNANGGAIMLRKGYLDFKWPGTKTNFLVGFQTVSLPSAVGGGSPILDDQMAAAIVVTPLTDSIKLLAGYSRLLDVNTAQTTTASTLSGSHNAIDAVFAALPMDFKGVSVVPYAAYASMGRGAVVGLAGSTAGAVGMMGPNSSNTEGIRGYWGGAALTLTLFDPFKIMADLHYGKATFNNASATMNKGGRSGWLADMAVDYTGLPMMTPSLFAAYSSGEKGNSTQNDGKSGRMPVVGSPQNYALGSFFLGGGDTLSGTIGTPDVNMGYWTVGLSLKDIKLIDKLSHTFHLLYIKGTNDVDYLKENTGTVVGANYGRFLTTKDSLWEVDFNSKYQIYDELALGLELGYINASFDKQTWRNAPPPLGRADYDVHGSASAYKAAMFVQYNF